VNIVIVTPVLAGAGQGEGLTTGNLITADRWRRLLTELGHTVTVAGQWRGEPADLLVALHAGKSRGSIAAWRRARPQAPLVIGLAGTDVYGDIHRDRDAAAALSLADRLIVLQPLAMDQLPAALRGRVRTIGQSALAPAGRRPPRTDRFEVCVVAHLREVKDPLLAAAAARLLPADSPVHIIHVGGALDPIWHERARAEAAANPRWHWRGQLGHDDTLHIIAASRLLALTSRSEGGANVISEAIACATPVVSTRIDGSIGILGADYPGYVEPGDAAGLAVMLHRCAIDPAFLAELTARVRALAPGVVPGAERDAWSARLAELPVV
jgi:putative glycosyltransferase (TIGR04348 family)